MVKGKEKFALWITPECKQLVDDCYADDQCQSRSEYIEKAILFYTGFLYAEKADRYLPKVLQQILSGTLDRFAERIGRQLFKLAVEQNVNNHILASDTDIDARSYQKMRGLSMDEVKRTNGRIDFEDDLKAAEEWGVLPMFYLELSTGLRRGELVALLWSDLNLQTKTLTVSKSVSRGKCELVVTEPKTENSVREIYLSDEAIRLLVEDRKNHPFSPYMFPSPKTGGMYGSGLRRKDSQKAAGKGRHRRTCPVS